MKVVNVREESFDIFIGRPSKWGNPFSHKEKSNSKWKTSNRKESIQKHKEWILSQPDLLNDLHEIRGKTLGCWCKPKSCHGDFLVELCNRDFTPLF